MKTLKFSTDQMQPIMNGQLRTTWRINDDKELSVDDQIECIEKRSGKAFGKAMINEVLTKRYGEITDNEMLKKLQTFYGDSIKPDIHVKVIGFTFEPYKELRDLPGSNFDLRLDEMKLYADGGSRGNPGPSASGWALLDMADNVVKKSGIYLGITTNNQAEYHALKVGLEEAKHFNPKVLHVFMDSLLVINQMKGIYKVKNRDLYPIYDAIKQMAATFPKVIYTHVPRALNKLADAEVNTTLDSIAKHS